MDKIREALVETVARAIYECHGTNKWDDIREPILSSVMDEARAALTAIPCCDGWRSVSEAPKDGTEIIGAFFDIRWADSHRKRDVVRCWWQPEFDAFISSCREMTLAPGLRFEDGTSRQLHSPVIEPITHWMPLPSQPKVET